MKSPRFFLLCLGILACAGSWGQQVQIRPGSVAGYVFSPKPTALMTTTVSTTAPSNSKSCYEFKLSPSLLEAEGAIYPKHAKFDAVDWVGEGTVKDGKFTGILYKKGCNAGTLPASGTAGQVIQNLCGGYTAVVRCPAGWQSSLTYGKGVGACIYNAGNAGQEGGAGGYYSYVEVNDVAVVGNTAVT